MFEEQYLCSKEYDPADLFALRLPQTANCRLAGNENCVAFIEWQANMFYVDPSGEGRYYRG
jgi:hypothetical protein